MPPKKERYWEERVKALKAQNPTWGAGRITAAMEKEAAREGLTDNPRERWVGSFLRTRYAKMTDAERREYWLFHWPDAMQRGDLPWEASAAALELMDVRRRVDSYIRWREQGGPKEVEPRWIPPDGWESLGLRWGGLTIGLVRWYWRVTQAVPDLPADTVWTEVPGYLIGLPDRYNIAIILAEWETDDNVPRELRDKLETYLSFAPWRSPERALEYRVKVEHGQLPGLSTRDILEYERARLGIPQNPVFLRDILGNDASIESGETQDQ